MKIQTDDEIERNQEDEVIDEKNEKIVHVS